jgi:hypothetical protein
MHLFRPVLVIAAFLCLNSIAAQDQEAAIKAVINQFFEGMETGDSSLLRAACTEAPLLQTISVDIEGQSSVHSQDFQAFVRFVCTPSQNSYDEQIEFAAIQYEEALASVWTPYKFYLNGQLRHCGTNSFQLVYTTAGWKIQYIIDTRRRTCD